MSGFTPPETFPSSGEIQYTGRAKRTDAQEAMSNDVVRGLVELITNADDAYAAAGVGSSGLIQIEAEHNRSGEYNKVIVRDHATGMTLDRVMSGLLRAGGEVSGHSEGLSRRGLHGRGAKDVSIFGKAEFRTIADGVYTRVVLLQSEKYEELETRPATVFDRTTMGLADGESGTEVVVFVRRQAHSVPHHANLADRLSRNVQLRDIVTASDRRVTLLDLGKGGQPDVLRYTRPAFVEEVLREEFSVPGYPDAKADLVIQRSDSQFEDDRSSTRHGGILVAGRRAVFEATYFSLENRAGARFFTGRLDCPYIDDLQDDFDAKYPDVQAANPIPIITRRREGIQRQHPFVAALKAEVEKRLLPFVDEAEKQADAQGGVVNEETRKRLKTAALKLGSVFRRLADAQELDVTDHGSGKDDDVQAVALEIVPDAATLAPDEVKVFSIFAWPELHDDGTVPATPTASVQLTVPEVATLGANSVELLPDPKRPGRLKGVVQVTAQDVLDVTMLEVHLGSYDASAIIEVIDPDPLPVDPPERLVFHQEAYSSRVGRKRRLMLWAPDALVARAGDTAVVRCNVESVLVQVGGFEPVEAETGERWQEAVVQVEGTTPAVAKVRAELGDQVAVARLTIRDPEGDNPFDFEIVKRAPEYESAGRAEWSSPGGVSKLTILAGHPSLLRYFGSDLEHQDEVRCLALVAEILADELAVKLVTQEEQKMAGTAADLFPDVHSYDSRRRQYASEFLLAAHEALVPEAGKS